MSGPISTLLRANKSTGVKPAQGLLALGTASAGLYMLNRQGFFNQQVAHADATKKTKLYAWGSAHQGQLGLGVEQPSVTKQTNVADLEDVALAQVVAFADKSAAITTEGDLIFWGSARNGSLVDGQGSTLQKNQAQPIVYEDPQGRKFKSVSCGKDHIGAVTVDGRLLMIGNNQDGKLGHKQADATGDRARVADSYQVSSIQDRASVGFVDIEGKKIRQVSCGFKHTACITEDGELYTWGNNKVGQLGSSDFTHTDVPRKVELSVKVDRVLCGSHHTIIMDSNKKIYAFGDNRYGQLGITGLDAVMLNHPAGIQTFLKKVRDIAVGEDHSAYIDEQGNVYTWGVGSTGQLGHGDKASHAFPKKVEVDFKCKFVACGGAHTAFVSEDDTMYTCGRGRDGQQGQTKLKSVSADRPTPVALDRFTDDKSHKAGVIEAVALGSNHTLAYVSF